MFKYKNLLGVGFTGKDCFGTCIITMLLAYLHEFPFGGRQKMVEVVKIGSNGALLQIKEVSDSYRDTPFRWDEDDS
jgi:hypothetical protein